MEFRCWHPGCDGRCIPFSDGIVGDLQYLLQRLENYEPDYSGAEDNGRYIAIDEIRGIIAKYGPRVKGPKS